MVNVPPGQRNTSNHSLQQTVGPIQAPRVLPFDKTTAASALLALSQYNAARAEAVARPQDPALTKVAERLASGLELISLQGNVRSLAANDEYETGVLHNKLTVLSTSAHVTRIFSCGPQNQIVVRSVTSHKRVDSPDTGAAAFLYSLRLISGRWKVTNTVIKTGSKCPNSF